MTPEQVKHQQIMALARDISIDLDLEASTNGVRPGDPSSLEACKYLEQTKKFWFSSQGERVDGSSQKGSAAAALEAPSSQQAPPSHRVLLIGHHGVNASGEKPQAGCSCSCCCSCVDILDCISEAVRDIYAWTYLLLVLGSVIAIGLAIPVASGWGNLRFFGFGALLSASFGALFWAGKAMNRLKTSRPATSISQLQLEFLVEKVMRGMMSNLSRQSLLALQEGSLPTLQLAVPIIPANVRNLSPKSGGGAS